MASQKVGPPTIVLRTSCILVISWSGNAPGYIVQYAKSGIMLAYADLPVFGDSTTTIHRKNSSVLSNLEPDHLYYVRIIAVDSADKRDSTSISDVVAFRTCLNDPREQSQLAYELFTLLCDVTPKLPESRLSEFIRHHVQRTQEKIASERKRLESLEVEAAELRKENHLLHQKLAPSTLIDKPIPADAPKSGDCDSTTQTLALQTTINTLRAQQSEMRKLEDEEKAKLRKEVEDAQRQVASGSEVIKHLRKTVKSMEGAMVALAHELDTHRRANLLARAEGLPSGSVTSSPAQKIALPMSTHTQQFIISGAPAPSTAAPPVAVKEGVAAPPGTPSAHPTTSSYNSSPTTAAVGSASKADLATPEKTSFLSNPTSAGGTTTTLRMASDFMLDSSKSLMHSQSHLFSSPVVTRSAPPASSPPQNSAPVKSTGVIPRSTTEPKETAQPAIEFKTPKPRTQVYLAPGFL